MPVGRTRSREWAGENAIDKMPVGRVSTVAGNYADSGSEAGGSPEGMLIRIGNDGVDGASDTSVDDDELSSHLAAGREAAMQAQLEEQEQSWQMEQRVRSRLPAADLASGGWSRGMSERDSPAFTSPSGHASRRASAAPPAAPPSNQPSTTQLTTVTFGSNPQPAVSLPIPTVTGTNAPLATSVAPQRPESLVAEGAPASKVPGEAAMLATSAVREAARHRHLGHDSVPMHLFDHVCAYAESLRRLVEERDRAVSEGEKQRQMLRQELERVKAVNAMLMDAQTPEMKLLREQAQDSTELTEQLKVRVRVLEVRVRELVCETEDLRETERKSANVLAVCEEALQAARNNTESHLEEKAQLQAHIDACDAEIRRLKDDASEHARSLEALKQAGAQMVKEQHNDMMAVQGKLADAAEREANLMAKVECGDDMVRQLRSQLDEWATQIEEKEADSFALQSQLNKMSTEVAVLQHTNKTQEDTLVQTQRQFTEIYLESKRRAAFALLPGQMRLLLRRKYHEWRLIAAYLAADREREAQHRRTEQQIHAALYQRDQAKEELEELRDQLERAEQRVAEQLRDAEEMRVKSQVLQAEHAAQRAANELAHRDMQDLAQVVQAQRDGATPEILQGSEVSNRAMVEAQESQVRSVLLTDMHSFLQSSGVCETLTAIANEVASLADLDSSASPSRSTRRREELAAQREQQELQSKARRVASFRKVQELLVEADLRKAASEVADDSGFNQWAASPRSKRVSEQLRDHLEMQREGMVTKATRQIQLVTDRLEQKRLEENRRLRDEYDRERSTLTDSYEQRLQRLRQELDSVLGRERQARDELEQVMMQMKELRWHMEQVDRKRKDRSIRLPVDIQAMTLFITRSRVFNFIRAYSGRRSGRKYLRKMAEAMQMVARSRVHSSCLRKLLAFSSHQRRFRGLRNRRFNMNIAASARHTWLSRLFISDYLKKLLRWHIGLKFQRAAVVAADSEANASLAAEMQSELAERQQEWSASIRHCRIAEAALEAARESERSRAEQYDGLQKELKRLQAICAQYEDEIDAFRRHGGRPEAAAPSAATPPASKPARRGSKHGGAQPASSPARPLPQTLQPQTLQPQTLQPQTLQPQPLQSPPRRSPREAPEPAPVEQLPEAVAVMYTPARRTRAARLWPPLLMLSLYGEGIVRKCWAKWKAYRALGRTAVETANKQAELISELEPLAPPDIRQRGQNAVCQFVRHVLQRQVEGRSDKEVVQNLEEEVKRLRVEVGWKNRRLRLMEAARDGPDGSDARSRVSTLSR
eukprot:Hpha_TRINITY_DN12069_c0_g1::TRINITY_DN12069_c0_g1_i1::g.141104::m.141104